MDANKNTKHFNSLHSKKKGKPKLHRNYTHHELLDNINRYKQFIKSKEDTKDVDKIKEAYLKREGTKDITRAERDKMFLLAQRTGISPEKTLIDIRNEDKIQDKIHRQNIDKKVKEIYRRNFDVLKKFKHLTVTKDGVSKEKNKPLKVNLKIPHRVKGEKNKGLKSKHFNVVERFGYASGVEPKSKSKSTKESEKNYKISERFAMTNKAIPKTIGKDKSKEK